MSASHNEPEQTRGRATLEEKIGAVIERKRALMESVVVPDDPKLAKAFSREELLDLLAPL